MKKPKNFPQRFHPKRRTTKIILSPPPSIETCPIGDTYFQSISQKKLSWIGNLREYDN